MQPHGRWNKELELMQAWFLTECMVNAADIFHTVYERCIRVLAYCAAVTVSGFLTNRNENLNTYIGSAGLLWVTSSERETESV